MCNTPVVFFKNTSIEDVCKSKKIGGYGADYLNSKDLAEGIKWIAENPNNSKILAQKGSDEIISKFNSEILIKNLLKTITSTINNNVKFND